ncbi:MAG: hypothetical protein RR054_03585 [Clostridia bacterium]
MNKFRIKLSKPITIFIIVFLIFWIGTILYNVFRWTKLFGLYSVSLPYEISQTILAVIVIIMLSFILNMRYSVTHKGVRLILIWDIMGNQIKIDKIWKVVVAQKKLYVCFTNKIKEPQIALISINEKYYDNFISALKNLNKNILAENADIEEDNE